MKSLKGFIVVVGLGIFAFSMTSCLDGTSESVGYYYAVTDFSGASDAMCASDPYGENLYGQGYYWLDGNTGLGSKPIDDMFYSGGTAISSYGVGTFHFTADNYSEWYKYQLVVDNADFVNPGYGGAEKCLVSYGYNDPNGWMGAPTINFTDTDTTCRVIEGLYICPTSYSVAQMTIDVDGTGAPEPEYFKVIFTGYDAYGVTTGTVEAYLAIKNSSFSVYEGWQPVYLYTLGRIHTLQIDLESTDVGEWGMNTPAYVAIDGIVVRVDVNDPVRANANNIITQSLY